MEVHPDCCSNAEDPGVSRATGAWSICCSPPPLKTLVYCLYVSLSAFALLINISSAETDVSFQTFYDQGYPPFFRGVEPALTDVRTRQGVSFVSRKKDLFTVPREHLVLEYDEGQARLKGKLDGRPTPEVRHQETPRAPALHKPQVEPSSRKPVVAKGRKEPSVQRHKTVVKIKTKKKEAQVRKKTKALPRVKQGKKQVTDKYALFKGVLGAIVILLCLLTIRPVEAVPMLRVGVSSVAAAFAHANLSEWYKSRKLTH